MGKQEIQMIHQGCILLVKTLLHFIDFTFLSCYIKMLNQINLQKLGFIICCLIVLLRIHQFCQDLPLMASRVGTVGVQLRFPLASLFTQNRIDQNRSLEVRDWCIIHHPTNIHIQSHPASEGLLCLLDPKSRLK